MIQILQKKNLFQISVVNYSRFYLNELFVISINFYVYS